MNFLQKVLLYQGGKVRYGTAGTTTTTTLASQGGLLINIDSATGDIARTTDGWIEDEKYGIRLSVSAATVTAKFSSTIVKTGRLTIQFDCSVNAASFPQLRNVGITPPSATWVVNEMTKYGIPIKGSTKYRIYFPIETVNTGGTGAYLAYSGYSTTGTRFTNVTQLTPGTFNGIKVYEFTSNASDAYLFWSIGYQSGCTGTINIDYNNFRFEEVVEPVANSLTSSSPALVSFTAVGSTDNIDQNLDPTFVAVNTYTPPVAISETATNKQTFTPTKSKLTRIGVYPVAKGTGNWTVTVHDASNVVQATITIANASLTNGAVNYFNVPCNLTALGTYHFHVTSTVADGTVKVGTATDLETVSYIQNYYKPTTNFKASQNNSTMQISADEDGFLDGSAINLTTGSYSSGDLIRTKWDGTAIDNSYQGLDIRKLITKYSSTSVAFASGTAYNVIIPTSSTNGTGYVVKIQSPLTINSLSFYYAGNTTAGVSALRYSYDNIGWTTVDTTDHAATFAVNYSIFKTTNLTGLSTNLIYIEIGNVSGSPGFGSFTINGNITTSSLSTLRNYPTNKYIIKQYSKTLGSATTSATYRATKWGFPAIEYSSTEYQFLDVDTTATGSTVAFSELGTTYTTVADGASLAITSTSTPNIFVKANITANRLYLSSNDYNANSDKDGSLKQSVVYKVMQ